jgi:hypothetical protein
MRKPTSSVRRRGPGLADFVDKVGIQTGWGSDEAALWKLCLR